jgi:vancomycin resistance protein YoaR
MNKQTVGYSESVEMFNPLTGLKKWVKVWNEKEINADEDRNVAFNDVQSFVQNKFHKDNNPQLTDGETVEWLTTFQEGHGLKSSPIPQPLQSIDPKKKDETEIAIDNATTLEDLEKLLVDAVKYNLVSQFNEKKKMLQ